MRCKIIFIISGNESEDDGYDAAYGDVGIETVSSTLRSKEPMTLEAVTTINNVYYENSNGI